MIVDAGHEGVAALDAMHQPLRAQEIERTVNGNGSGPPVTLGKTVDQLISPQRLMRGKQYLKHGTAYRRQALAAPGAERLGMRKRVVRTPVVVMTGGGENRMRSSGQSLLLPP